MAALWQMHPSCAPVAGLTAKAASKLGVDARTLERWT
jgi:hypothetical protein